METTIKTRALTSILSDIEAGMISFRHPLQRKPDQWNSSLKSKIIDSTLRGYPIGQIFTTQKDDIIYIIDGQQRLTTINDFIVGKFKLSRFLSPVTLSNGAHYEIKNMRFEKLTEELRTKLLNTEIQVCKLENYTDEDVRNIFDRLNGGVPLTKDQKLKVLMPDDMLINILKLSKHPFFEKTGLTKGQYRRESELSLICQCLMLTTNYEITGFYARDIETFIKRYKENYKDGDFIYLETILDKLDEIIEVKENNLKRLTIPVLVAALGRVIGNDRKTRNFAKWLKRFFDNYESNLDYHQFCLKETAKKDMVNGRLSYFTNAV